MTRQLGSLSEIRRPAKFAHFVLRCTNLQASKQWYSTVLGARVVFENPSIAFLTYDDEHHRLALAQFGEVPQKPPHAAGLDHVAYTYDTLGDLLHNYERLKAADIKPVWCVNHGPTTSMYYADPDGNRVEMQIDNFPTVEELNGWFRSGEFEKNPIGVTFNPDKLVERYQGGASQEELVRQGAA